MTDAPATEAERTALAHGLLNPDGSVRAPECCGVRMADSGGCYEGCCDYYNCSLCGKHLRVEHGA